MSGVTDIFDQLQSSTGAKVQQLDADTKEAIGRIESDLETNQNQNALVNAIEEAEQRLAEAIDSGHAMTEEDIARIRESILNATVRSVRKDRKQKETDLATTIYGMTGILQQIG
ncbi:MAG: hypothetical protein MRY49_02670 [Candidatus Pacebacteria bacterium]|nr:hypothetical protein [Candidatus Paceibacterota bacterium]